MKDNIFDYIKDVLFTKKKKYINYSNEQLQFSPYMLQRWCSMADKRTSIILNNTTNKWLIYTQDKQYVYKLLSCILPKIQQKKIAYLKKQNKSDKKEDISNICKNLECSEREYNEALKILNNL
jgi:hypothetical protein